MLSGTADDGKPTTDNLSRKPLLGIASKQLVGSQSFFIERKGKVTHSPAEVNLDAGMNSSVGKTHHVNAHRTTIREARELALVIVNQALQKRFGKSDTP